MGVRFGSDELFLVFVQARMEKLPEKVLVYMGGVSAWTATLLFMWGPVAQMVSHYCFFFGFFLCILSRVEDLLFDASIEEFTCSLC